MNVPEVQFGNDEATRKRKRMKIELNWTKKSIFFELPYWSTLKLRHNLDVMHIEKNICDSVLGMLMYDNGKGKNKDTSNARKDLEDISIREELHLQKTGTSTKMPQVKYILKKAENTRFCDWLKNVKFPDGYASNIVDA